MRPLVQRIAKWGITPNQVTISALGLSIVTGILLFFYHEQTVVFAIIPVVLFIRMALNAIDGMLAREHDQKTPLGNILNELGDVLADAAMYLPFAYVAGLDPILIVLIVLFSIISEMTGILGVVIGASRRYDGPMGKSDRAFVFGLLSLLLAIGVSLQGWGTYLLGLVLILLFANIGNRIYQALKEIA